MSEGRTFSCLLVVDLLRAWPKDPTFYNRAFSKFPRKQGFASKSFLVLGAYLTFLGHSDTYMHRHEMWDL